MVTRFLNTGIVLTGASGTRVERNFVGTDGTSALGNAAGGVFVNLGSGNVISGNVVSGNGSSGILLFDGATNTTVTDNRIGTNAAGTAALGNTYAGIYVHDSATTLNTIARNVCSGNGNVGISISTGTHHNTITGNLIGSDAGGALPLPNGLPGIVIQDTAHDNAIGGTTPGAGNTIVANGGSGILLTNTHDNTIQGNWIGTNSAMASGLGNTQNGIETSAAVNNSIGGAAAGAGNVIVYNLQGGMLDKGTGNQTVGNVISGNGSNGITLDAGASAAVIANNKIGTNSAGIAAFGNTGDGVGIYNGASGNTVSDNVVAASTFNGIRLNNNATGNTIRHNWIGTNTLFTPGLGNGNQGISVEASTANTIGGPVAGDGNVVASNAQGGILLESGSTATQILGNVVSRNVGDGISVLASPTATIVGNLIGTDASGTSAIPNTGNGIYLGNGSVGCTIGGNIGGAGNVIAGNLGIGLLIAAGSDSNNVQGNWIGTNPSSAAGLGNGAGVSINGGSNLIGGTAPGSGNVIAGNLGAGLAISSASGLNFVQGNWIGTNPATSTGLGNASAGVDVDSGNNLVGGAGPGAGNVIAFNGGYGVAVSSGSGNAIVSNLIFGNMSLGIYLGSGANDDLNAPVITSAVDYGTNTTVSGTVNVGVAGATVILQFFANDACDSSGYGQGQTLVGATSVVTGGDGTASFSVNLPTGLAGKVVTATTNTLLGPGGNTSEFSACMFLPQADFIFSPASPHVEQPVQFTETSVGATEWLWSFGDDNMSTDQNPVHTYASPGTYNVTLVASNDAGSATVVKVVAVSP